jgi:hypothetical protein
MIYKRLALATLLGVSVWTIWGCSRGENAVTQEAPVKQEASDDELDVQGLGSKIGPDGVVITGQVVNRRKQMVKKAVIYYGIFDASGDIIQHVHSETTNLPPGGVWNFEVHYWGGGAAEYRLSDLKGE